MKTLHLCLIAISLLAAYSAVQAEGFYKWKDARGVIQYGDQPPPSVKAEKMAMPAITVIENYSEQWKPMQFDKADDLPLDDEPVSQQLSSGAYNKLEFIAPKANQSIRANDGDVTAIISLKPVLKAGHAIAFYLDGKEVSKGESRTTNFSNLPRGEHAVAVKILDQKGKVIKTSSVNFTVQRFSTLLNKKKP